MASTADSPSQWSRSLVDGGDTGARLRAIDWRSTEVGTPGEWPDSFRTTLGILLASTQPMFMVWGAGRMYLYNDAYAPLIGLKHPGALGAPYLQVWADQLPRVVPLVETVMVRGEALFIHDMAFDIDHVHEARSERYFSFSLTPVRDEQRVTGMLGVCIETTDRIDAGRRAEAAMQALTLSERRYRALFESMTEGFCVIELIEATATQRSDFRYVVVNPAFAQVTLTDNVLGRTIRGVFPEKATEWIDTYENVLRTRRPILFERRLAEVSLDLQIYAYPVLEHTHQVAVVFSDITPRKDEERRRQQDSVLLLEAKADVETHRDRLQLLVEERTTALSAANQALQEANEFTRRVTDMVPARIAYFDADLICQFANRSFCDWLGRDPADVVHQPVDALLNPRTAAAYGPLTDAGVTSSDVPRRLEGQARGPDGRLEHFLVDYVPEPRTHATRRRGIHVLAVDVTALKTAGQRLQLLNADLERARDEAQNANRAKSAFLANMSHEIRTPLNAIIGMTHILSREIDAAGQKDRLAKVDDAAQHLRGLIDDILDLSKIEADKLTLESEAFELAEVVSRSVTMVQQAALDKGLRLGVETEGLPAFLRGDRLRLSQIVLNLLSNAVKFTSEGFVTLRGRLLEREGDRVHLRFEVVDSGPGIAASALPRLFGAFEQADNSTSRRHGGTGLGLALSRKLARAMGGDAGVESELGVGSVFWFTVRMDEVERPAGTGETGFGTDAADGFHLDVEAAEELVRSRHGGQRVLLAEDNPINREVGTALLQSAGLEVHAVADGQAASGMALTGDFDLVLMDMRMPRLDGLAAAREIRLRLPDLPIIAMTANAFAEDRRACLDAGMNDHVGKPVDPVGLYSVLLTWLPRRPG